MKRGFLSLCIALFLTSNLYALDVKTDKGIFPHGMADGGMAVEMFHNITFKMPVAKQTIMLLTEDGKCHIFGVAQYDITRANIKLEKLSCIQKEHGFAGITIDGYVVSLEDNLNGLKVEEPTVTNDDFKAEVKMQKAKAIYSFAIK